PVTFLAEGLGRLFCIRFGDLRNEDAPMCAKSQFDSNIPQALDDITRNSREQLQLIQYRHALKQANIDLSEHYINGELALVLDCVFKRKTDRVRAVATDSVTIARDNFSFLILHNNVRSLSDANGWDKQPMLISDIQIVKHFNHVIPTSCVRLYIGDNPIKQSRSKSVYFSTFESVFYVFPGLPNREFGVEIALTRNEFLDGSNPCIFDSDSQIVNSVCQDNGHVVSKFLYIRQCVRDYLTAYGFITLQGGSVGVFQHLDSPLKVRNVFVGP